MTDLAAAVARLVQGDRGTLARALTLVENAQSPANELLEAVRAHTGQAHAVGITGAPGVGKSSLCSALISEWRSRGHRVGVLAIDPSSAMTGGALLGDRVRMHEHDDDEAVFVRSVAARRNGGGLAACTADAVTLLDAAGMDCILVETVGTGQSDIDITGLVQTTVLVNAPGLGDEVQALKAGILEMADVLVVNKADLAQAQETAGQLRAALGLRQTDGWVPPVLMTSALSGDGLSELADTLQHHRDTCQSLTHRSPPCTEASWPHRLAGRDPFAKLLGIELVAASVGDVRVRMRVRSEHINFNGTCHGGVLFSLADTAFGLASNSHGLIAAGIDAHITYPRAVRVDDTLTAQAREETRSRRFGTYRVIVTRSDGATVATFTGTVAITGEAQT